MFHNVIINPGGIGSLKQTFPNFPGTFIDSRSFSSFSSSFTRISISYPGIGLQQEPGLTSNYVRAKKLEQTHQPVSVYQ